MAKISLSKLNLEKDSNINTITINDNEIEVLSYLPTAEKISMIDIVIQESTEGQRVNPILVDCLFHTYLVMSYTNLSFTGTQKSKILETYDLMEKNGLIAEVIKAIPAHEYNDLVESLSACVDSVEKELNSIANVVRLTLEQATSTLTKVSEELENLNLDSDKIQAVLSIARDNGIM